RLKHTKLLAPFILNPYFKLINKLKGGKVYEGEQIVEDLTTEKAKELHEETLDAFEMPFYSLGFEGTEQSGFEQMDLLRSIVSYYTEKTTASYRLTQPSTAIRPLSKSAV
ncbi:MAG: hypothetical protein LUB61_04250, partial [Eggerthellaceae bacterium]|nr:hypothetical protein [Eggerthellaceae bacterium]